LNVLRAALLLMASTFTGPIQAADDAPLVRRPAPLNVTAPLPDDLAAWQQFNLPLTNGTTATAFVLPAASGRDYLVVSKPGSPPRVTVYVLTPHAGPLPPVPPGPDPPVPPGPDPPVPPVPIKQSLAVVVIEETASRPAWLARILASPTFFAYLNEHKHSWRLLDKDVTDENGRVPPELAPWLDLAKGQTLPFVVLATRKANGLEKVYAGPAPQTEAALKALLGKYGGE
jgi:hypothetical protein